MRWDVFCFYLVLFLAWPTNGYAHSGAVFLFSISSVIILSSILSFVIKYCYLSQATHNFKLQHSKRFVSISLAELAVFFCCSFSVGYIIALLDFNLYFIMFFVAGVVMLLLLKPNHTFISSIFQNVEEKKILLTTIIFAGMFPLIFLVMMLSPVYKLIYYAFGY